jgi:hypothetical protein
MVVSREKWDGEFQLRKMRRLWLDSNMDVLKATEAYT